MTIRTKAVLKSYYNTGDTPSEANFADWIDMVPPEPFALYVAASDAEAREIASADYVCDGTDDDVQIIAAIAAAAAGGGRVVLSSGNFNLVNKLDLSGLIISIEGQGRYITNLNFVLGASGECITLSRTVSLTARATLKGFGIIGDNTNSAIGIFLTGGATGAAHNSIEDIYIYRCVDAIHGDSGNSQNLFVRILTRDCADGFWMDGVSNTYIGCIVSMAGGVLSAGIGFHSTEQNSAYFSCASEYHEVGYNIGAYAVGTSYFGCVTEKTGHAIQIGGTAPDQPVGITFSGGGHYTMQDATDSVIIVNTSISTSFLGVAVMTSTSGKSMLISGVGAVDTMVLGGYYPETVADAGTTTTFLPATIEHA